MYLSWGVCNGERLLNSKTVDLDRVEGEEEGSRKGLIIVR